MLERRSRPSPGLSDLEARALPAGCACSFCRHAIHDAEDAINTSIPRGFLLHRWAEGMTTGAGLFGEILQRGYAGSYSHLAKLLAP